MSRPRVPLRGRAPAVLAAAAALALLAAGAAPAAAGAHPAAGRAKSVLVYAVPGLVWHDVVAGMPRLAALARTGAAGALSVKAQGPVTRCAAGELTLSAGNRAAAPGSSCLLDAASLAALRGRDDRLASGARVGALGSALHAAGLRTAAVGAAAVAILADRSGAVDVPGSDLGRALRAAAVVAVVDDGLYRVAAGRAAARRAVDARIAAALGQLPAGAAVLVVGLSDGSSGPAHLHVAVLAGPGVGSGALASPSTGRAPFVQLVDVAPTVLHLLGLAAPPAMVGTPMHPARGSAAPAALDDLDRRSVAGRRLATPLQVTLVVALLTSLVALLAGLHGPGPWAARPAPAVAAFCAATALLPLDSFLAEAVPWWRCGEPAFAGLLAAGGVLAGVAGWRLGRRPAATVAGLLALVSVVLVADVLTGSHLQLASPLGDSPLVAGRFTGIGNLALGVLGAAALATLGVVDAAAARRGLPAGLPAALGGLLLVVVVGLPSLGDKLGGTLALVPAVVVVALLRTGTRVTPARVGAAVLLAALAAAGFAGLDYARPPAQRTHLGRFVGQVLHGGAGTVLRRKLDAAAGTYVHSALVLAVLGALVFLILERRRVGAAAAQVPGLPAGLAGALVAAVLGGLVNDTGSGVPALAAVTVLPLAGALALLAPARQ